MNASDTSEVVGRSSIGKSGSGSSQPKLRQDGSRLQRLRNALGREINGLVELLKISPPLTPQVLQRIEMMEQHFILPIKAAWIAILLRPSNYSWIGEQATNLEVNQTSAYCIFWTYVVISVVAGMLVLFLRRIPPAVAEGTVFAITLVDGIFLAVLTVVTGG